MDDLANVQAQYAANDPRTPPLTFNRDEIASMGIANRDLAIPLAIYARDAFRPDPVTAESDLRNLVATRSMVFRDEALFKDIQRSQDGLPLRDVMAVGYHFGFLAKPEGVKLPKFDIERFKKYPQAVACWKSMEELQSSSTSEVSGV